MKCVTEYKDIFSQLATKLSTRQFLFHLMQEYNQAMINVYDNMVQSSGPTTEQL